jgi:hypothetical protein
MRPTLTRGLFLRGISSAGAIVSCGGSAPDEVTVGFLRQEIQIWRGALGSTAGFALRLLPGGAGNKQAARNMPNQTAFSG